MFTTIRSAHLTFFKEAVMRTPAFLALLGFVTPFAIAQSYDVPLSNWTVPPYRGLSTSGGLTTMADISPGIGFVAMQPCRIVDTRGGGVFTGAYGPPIMAANAIRPFDLNSSPHCTGIPAGVEAYSLNFTATQTAGPSGDIRAWPTGNPPVQVTSVLNWTVTNAVVANAIIVPAGTNGFIDVQVAGSNTHLLIDINGYFTDEYNVGNQFVVNASIAAKGAIHGINPSPINASAGVRGDSSAATATGQTFGVWGETASSAFGASGVIGVASSATGFAFGTWGETASAADGVAGVYGDTLNTKGRNYGVWGQSRGGLGSAGVLGQDASGVTPGIFFGATAGVRGESNSGYGVLGLTRNEQGVTGVLVDDAGFEDVAGALGFAGGSTNYGVFSSGPAIVFGDLEVNGDFSSSNKFFVEPHPHDASKEIRYVSLEGPHAEVYFRGTAQVSLGVTRIAIPQDFRFVADPATYSTLVTPVGAMATVAVLAEGEEGVLVRASRDVRVHYVVYAERKAVKNPDPIAENEHFRPQRDHDAFRSMPESYRKLLMQNGTLNPDGTVNMETARRLGWDWMWEKRKDPAPQTTPE
jgi:hypothetical protein